MKKAKRPTKIQEEMLLECLEERLWLVLGRNRSEASRTRARDSWQEIAKLLNQHRNGVSKTAEQWRKYWKDKKAALKRKLQDLEENDLSDADQSTSNYLTEVEQEMLRIIMQVEERQAINTQPALSAQAGVTPNRDGSQSSADNNLSSQAEYNRNEALLQSERNDCENVNNAEGQDCPIEQSPKPAAPCRVSEWTTPPEQQMVPLTDSIESVDPCNSTMNRTKKLTIEQEEMLVKCLAKQLWLVQERYCFCGARSCELSQERAEAAWQDIAKILNHFKDGVSKTPEQWRKYCKDKKAALKRKLQDLEKNKLSAADPSNYWTEFEPEMLRIVKQVEECEVINTELALSAQARVSLNRDGSQSSADISPSSQAEDNRNEALLQSEINDCENVNNAEGQDCTIEQSPKPAATCRVSEWTTPPEQQIVPLPGSIESVDLCNSTTNRSKRLTIEQEEMLVKCLKQQLWLVQRRNVRLPSRERARQAWQEIAKILNHFKDGVSKTPEHWRKYWKEKKAALKRKLQDLEKNQISAADPSNHLTEFEQEILRITMQVEECQVIHTDPALSAQAEVPPNRDESQSSDDNSPSSQAEGDRNEALLQSEKNYSENVNNAEGQDCTIEQSPKPAATCRVSEWTTPPEQQIPLKDSIESIDPCNSSTNRSKRLTIEQEEMLVKCFEKRLWLLQGRNAAPRARAAWQEIAKILNHFRNGVYKTPNKWRKYWKDKKGNLKRKLKQLENNQPRAELTDLEERILKIMRVERSQVGNTKPALSPQAGVSANRGGSQSPADNAEDEEAEDPLQLPDDEGHQGTGEQRLDPAYPTRCDSEWTATTSGQWMVPLTEAIDDIDPYTSTENLSRAKAPTLLQQEVLLKYLEKRLWLVAGKHRCSEATRLRVGAAWQKIAKILNHQRNGNYKSRLQWKKYWRDKRASLIRRFQKLEKIQSAAAPNVGDDEFSDLEQRMLKIVMQAEHSQVSNVNSGLSLKAGVSPSRGGCQLPGDETEHDDYDEAKDGTDEQRPDPAHRTRCNSESTRQRRVARKKRTSERVAIDVHPNNSTRDTLKPKAPTLQQQEVLLKCLEKRLWLGQGRNQFTAARLRSRAAWQEIARKLNSHKDGVYRSWSQWAKYWKDKKAALKRKLQQIEKNHPSAKQTNYITGIEQRMLKILMRDERPQVSNTEPEPSQAGVPNTGGSQSPADNADHDEDSTEELRSEPARPTRRGSRDSGSSATPSRRRRVVARKRRSQMAALTERFLTVEERRVDNEGRIMQALRTMSDAWLQQTRAIQDLATTLQRHY